MDQSQGNSGGMPRPEVLNDISETQMQELERAFNDSGPHYFEELGHSYGWSKEQVAEVRAHFNERVGSGQGGQDSQASSQVQ